MFQALYQIGVFVSRSSCGYAPIERMWILAVLQVRPSPTSADESRVDPP